MWERVKQGMSRTRQRFTEQMNVLLDRGPDVDDDFWDGLEEALILSDVGAQTSANIVANMRDEATRQALPDAYAVMDRLSDRIAEAFVTADVNIFDENPVCVLFVGINGAGKTTTVGKIAYEAKSRGRKVLLGCGDTFRAAAIEQLEEWSHRAGVEIVERERGADPASVCYETIERAEALGSNLVLIDTAGRLHTSDDLMRELQKVVNVVRKRANMTVRTVLVIDATTGQNGLSQAREFNKALDLDAIIVTKLDGTARGGIALAVSSELQLPIAKVGVGEGLQDLQEFDARDFSAALIGAEPEEEPTPASAPVAPVAPVAAVIAVPESPCEPEVVSETEPETEPLAEDLLEAQAEPLAEPASEEEPAPEEEEVSSQSLEEAQRVREDEPSNLESSSETGEEEDLSQLADAAFEEYEAQHASDAKASENETTEGESDQEEESEKEGRFKRLFRWRGRK